MGELVILLSPRMTAINMENKTLEIIKQRVAQSQGVKNPVIEYNFKELPKDENITPTSFYGVPAKFYKEVAPESATLTYTY